MGRTSKNNVRADRKITWCGMLAVWVALGRNDLASMRLCQALYVGRHFPTEDLTAGDFTLLGTNRASGCARLARIERICPYFKLSAVLQACYATGVEV